MTGTSSSRRVARAPLPRRIAALQRLYEVLGSTESAQAVFFAWTTGFQLSLERNPNRRWLIPIFGLEMGGLIQEKVGHRFTATPLIGAHVFADRNMSLSILGGYAMVPSGIDRYGGWRALAGGSLTFW